MDNNETCGNRELKRVNNLFLFPGDRTGDLCWRFGDPFFRGEGDVPRVGDREIRRDGDEDTLPGLGDL